ncbi:MAG: carbohydrate kinase family protein [Armatimonadota bacterium]
MRSGIICAGVSCVDLFLYGTEPLATRESLSMVRETKYRPGGATSNTGRALAGLGVPAAYFTVIGDDANGEILLNLWQVDGVDTQYVVRTKEAGTALSTVPVYGDGKRGVYFYPGTNDIMGTDNLLGAGRRNLQVLRQSQAFHIGYPPLLRCLQGQALADLLALVRETGVLISLDTTPIADDITLREMLAPALPLAHLFAPNIEEAAQVTGRFTALAERACAAGADIETIVTPDELRQIGEDLLRLGVPLVIITLGPNGAYLCTGDAAFLRTVPFAPADLSGWADLRAFVPGYRVDGPLNSAGAGDTFTAAVLTGICNGAASLAEAVAIAHCAAALHVDLSQELHLYAEVAALHRAMPVVTSANPHLTLALKGA